MFNASARAADDVTADSHHTPAGFFDVHVCNWPDRPRFLMALFSTTRPAEVIEVAVFLPDGRRLGALDLNKYRVLPRKKGKPKKHAYISYFAVPVDAEDGWYTAEIRLADGARHRARDLVLHRTLARPENLSAAGMVADIPPALSWNPVPGATYYQVFVKDLWGDGAVSFSSDLVTQPRVVLPPGLLRRDGSYAWRVHARDVNQHPQFGDFNHGSLSDEAVFFIKP